MSADQHPLPPTPDMPVHTVPHDPAADDPADSQPRRVSPPRPAPTPPSTQTHAGPSHLAPPRPLSVHPRRPMSRGPSISFHDPRPASLNFPAIRDLSTADPAAWPVDARYRPKTVGERLAPTLKVAREKRDEAAARAKRTGVTLNVAIGGQVVLGALTTAVSAATIGNGRSTSIATSVLGGVATLIASYLARMRGSSEPESSIRLTMDLDQFLRDIEAFVLDHGHETGYPPAHTFSTPSSPLPGAFPPLNAGTPSEKLTDDTDELRGKWDERVAAFRRRLDQLLAQGGAAGGGENRAVV